jgi:hypothetical protein
MKQGMWICFQKMSPLYLSIFTTALMSRWTSDTCFQNTCWKMEIPSIGLPLENGDSLNRIPS